MTGGRRRVCIMLPAHWSAIAGGAELQVRYLMQALVRRPDTDVFYVCRHGSSGFRDGVLVMQVDPRGRLSRYTYLPDYPLVMKALQEIRPHVIYARVASPYIGMAARYCRSTSCRLVWHIALESDVLPYRLNGRRSLMRLGDRLLFEHGARRAHVIVGQARYQDALLAARFQRRCTAIIPNFHPLPAPQAKPEGIVRVVWVASLKASKRPEAFVELARRLQKHEDMEFVMIGPVQDDEWHQRISRETDCLANLTYRGPLSLEEVNHELACSHIYVNTSRIEGFPNNFVQAWLRRTVVVSLTVDPDEVLSRVRRGRLSGTMEGLVEDVRALALDPATRQHLADDCYDYACRHHSMANADQLADLILAQAQSLWERPPGRVHSERTSPS